MRRFGTAVGAGSGTESGAQGLELTPESLRRYKISRGRPQGVSLGRAHIWSTATSSTPLPLRTRCNDHDHSYSYILHGAYGGHDDKPCIYRAITAYNYGKREISVRSIGTLDLHITVERALTRVVATDDISVQ